MSVEVMTLVWTRAPYEGGTLLVLLALADWANDEGDRIYPKIETLARKARVSVRTAQYALGTLKADGFLTAIDDEKGGRGKVTRYHLDVKRMQALHPIAIPKGADDDAKGCKTSAKRVQTTTPHIDNRQVEPLKEPSTKTPPSPKSDSTKVPTELEQAFEAYNESAERAGWRRCERMTADREKRMRKRLKTDGLDGWRRALLHAETSDFLCGKCPPREGQDAPFRASIDFLLQEQSYARLVEGWYDNKKPRNGGGPLFEDESLRRQRIAMEHWKATGVWAVSIYGAKPGEVPGRHEEPCKIAPAVLAEFGYHPIASADATKH